MKANTEILRRKDGFMVVRVGGVEMEGAAVRQWEPGADHILDSWIIEIPSMYVRLGEYEQTIFDETIDRVTDENLHGEIK